MAFDVSVLFTADGSQLSAEGKRVTEQLRAVGTQARNTGQQTAQLSAQVQDLVVQIQAGQAPLTALIQQGSQLSAVYGGVGPMLKGITGLLSAKVVALGGAAAAIGTTVAAWAAGRNESIELAKAIGLTNNAAGLTQASFSSLAQTLGRDTRTGIGTAREALLGLVSDGRLGAAALNATGEAALHLSRATGESAAKVSQRFGGMIDDVYAGASKLTEQYNFLDGAQLKQIKRLEEQGNSQRALAVTMEALSKHVKDQVPPLGTLESAWERVGIAIAGVWDSAKKIGRTETLADQVAAAEARLQALQTRRSNNPQLTQQRIQNELQLISALQEQQSIEAGAAAMAAVRAERRRAEKKWLDDQNRSLDSQLQLERQIRNELENGRRAGASEQELAEHERRLRARAGLHKAAAAEIEREGDLLAELAGVSKGYNNELARLYGLRQRGLVDETRYVSLVEELIQKQPFAKEYTKQLADAERELAKVVADGVKARERYIEVLDRGAESQERELERLREEYVGLSAGRQALDDYRRARERVAIAGKEQRLASMEADEFVDPEVYRRLQAEIRRDRDALLLQELNAGLRHEKDIQADAEKSARALRDAYEREYDRIADGLMGAVKRGWPGVVDHFRDQLANTAFRVVLEPVIQPLAGFLATLSGGGPGAAGGAAGQAGQYAQLANQVSSLYGNYQRFAGWLGFGGTSGGLAAGGGAAAGVGGVPAGAILGDASMASTYTAMHGYYGGWAGSSLTGSSAAASMNGTYAGAVLGDASLSTTYGAVAGESTGAASAGMSGAAAAGWAAAFVAAYIASSHAYDQGYDIRGLPYALRNGPEAWSTRTLSALGVSDRYANIFGATPIAHSFGWSVPKIDAQGISGSFGAGDFSGQTFTDTASRPGWVRRLFGSSTRRETILGELPDQLGRMLDTAASGLLEHAKQYGAALGLPVEQLRDITAEIRIEAGEDGQLNKDEVAKAIAGYGDALVAGYAEALRPLAEYEETTGKTLERVAGNLLGVNEVMELLGLSALQTSVDGGKAATSLQALFGGIEGLAQQAGSYYRDFYPEAERAARATDAMRQALAELGLELPATRAEFRASVEAQDRTSESGQKAFATLLGLSGVFAELVPAARSAAEILDERTGLERQLLEVQGDAAALRRLERDALDDSNRALFDQVHALRDAQAIQQQRLPLERQLLELQGDAAALRRLERDALDPANRALWDQVQALTAAKAAASERTGLDRQLLELQGNGAELRRLERDALDESNRALYDHVRALQDQAAAAQKAAQQAAELHGAIDSATLRYLRDPAARQAYGHVMVARDLQAAGIGRNVPTEAGAQWLQGLTRDQIAEQVVAFINLTEVTQDQRIAAVRAGEALLELRDQAGDAARQLAEETGAKLTDLLGGLEDLLGTRPRTGLETLGDMLRGREALLGYRGELGGQIDRLRLNAMSPELRHAELLRREQRGFASFGSARDPVDAAKELSGIVVERIQLEAELRQALHKDEIENLRQRISGEERLRDIGRDLLRTVADLSYSDLSAYGYDRQLAEAQGLYARTRDSARAGDVTAAGQLGGIATSYLQEYERYSGHAGGYGPEFERVLGELGDLGLTLSGGAGGGQVAVWEARLAELTDTGGRQATVLTAIQDLLDGRLAQDSAAIGEQARLMQTLIDELRELREAQLAAAGLSSDQSSEELAVQQRVVDVLERIEGQLLLEGARP